jgi:hypothetical protein
MLSSAVEHYARQQRITLTALMAARGRLPVAELTRLVTVLQVAAAQDSIDSIEPMLDEQDISAPSTGLVPAAAFAGTASDGRALGTLFAQAASQHALELMVVTQIQDTARQAAAVSIATRPHIGYVRMLNPPSCSRCAILAGKFYRYNQGFLRHPRCDCRHVPSIESLAGDLTTDPNAYFHSLPANEQDRIFTKAGAEAIRLGADVGQVVNARRVTSGMQFAQSKAIKVDARGVRYTTEGTTRRGLAAQQQAGLRQHGPVQARLMPESILERAKDRDDAQRLLRLYGYITDAPAAARGRAILTQARREERRTAAVTRRAERREAMAASRAAGGSGGRVPPRTRVGGADAPDEYPATDTGVPVPFTPSSRPLISRGSRNHILAGHKAGRGPTGKTKFPASWSDDEIMDAVDAVMAKPQVLRHRGDQFIFRGEHRGVPISVSVRVDKPRPFVWTAYPLP